MKELSIEEKAQAYDNALQVLHKYDGANIMFSQDLKEEMFPELAELEDERIRKELLEHCKNQAKPYIQTRNKCPQIQSWITWLEKQGSKTNPYSGISFEYNGHIWGMCARDNGVDILLDKQLFKHLEKQGEQKLANIVEPKFHEGDWAVSNLDGKARQISEVHLNEYNSYYVVNGKSVNLEEYDRLHHLWTIQDAKDGDVLVNQNGEMPFIFKECKNNHIYCYCGYTNRKDIFFDRFVNSEGEELHWLNLYHEQVYPATKEQRDLLFQKMKEAGYEWDAGKKELKIIDWSKHRSEEDERMYRGLHNLIYSTQYCDLRKELADFLNSLKDRVQQQPKQEWSEADERNASYICAALDCYDRLREDRNNTNGQEDLDKARNWLYNRLKSLKPQNTWKPSDGQMERLKGTINSLPHQEVLYSLYQDLKKLKDE